jgi:hypothetical protein
MADQDALDEFVAKKAEGGFTKQEMADIGKLTKK